MKKTTLVIALSAIAMIAIIIGVARGGQSAVDLPTDRIVSTDWTKGNPSAGVTLIEYGDFQCPACAAYHTMVKSITEIYGPNIVFAFRHFPLTQIHRNAFLGALAAEAAGKQGKFWEMHDKLYDEQRAWSEAKNARDLFRQYAEALGLNGDQFATDLDDDTLSEKISADQKSGYAANIQGTPTFFLNGTLIESPQSLAEFKSLIDAALQQVPQKELTDSDFTNAAFAHTSADLLIMVNGKKITLPETTTSEYVKTYDTGTVIHRHKEGLTLGYALSSVGVTVSDSCITVQNTEYCADADHSLKFFVNGTRSLSINRYIFQTGDKIAISYGALTENIDDILKQIPDNAKKHLEEDEHKNIEADKNSVHTEQAQ